MKSADNRKIVVKVHVRLPDGEFVKDACLCAQPTTHHVVSQEGVPGNGLVIFGHV